MQEGTCTGRAHQGDAAACLVYRLDDLLAQVLGRDVLPPVDGVQQVVAQQAQLLQLVDELHHVALVEAGLQMSDGSFCYQVS